MAARKGLGICEQKVMTALEPTRGDLCSAWTAHEIACWLATGRQHGRTARQLPATLWVNVHRALRSLGRRGLVRREGLLWMRIDAARAEAEGGRARERQRKQHDHTADRRFVALVQPMLSGEARERAARVQVGAGHAEGRGRADGRSE